MSTKPTGPATANPTELDQLNHALSVVKAQVATLRTEMADLKRFLHVSQPDPDEAEPGGPSLVISCSGIMLRHHATPNKSQGLFMAGEDGPCLSLWGLDEKARVTLEVNADGGTCELFGKDLKRGVQLAVGDKDGRGQITVFDTDKPRALMKAMETGGAVSAVHDDGKTRACMTSTAHQGGEFLAITPDMQVGVKITGGLPDGGAVVVNRLNGKPAVIVATNPLGGAVIINDPKGNLMASLPQIPPATPEESDEH